MCAHARRVRPKKGEQFAPIMVDSGVSTGNSEQQMRIENSNKTTTMRKSLYILIACEESQAETIAFRALGHRAYSCDLQPVSKFGCPRWHIQGDVIPFLNGRTYFQVQSGKYEKVPGWDIIIAHPPCTYLCRMSSIAYAKSMREDGKRAQLMNEAREFFLQCLNAQAPFVAVKNPLPMAIANLPKPTTYACPSWFGSRYTKKTLYWLRNLPPLMPTIINPDATSLVRSTRGKYRSRTDLYLANALAKQWSEFVLLQINSRLRST